ncbi:MAG: hypothetical protein RMJ98_15130 [Myxococcales bacterium]|nr:hypothetical protein [Polyangiaceae bacterium]MDW8250626.1 hypothetical protein [Myxococcales bacterium]
MTTVLPACGVGDPELKGGYSCPGALRLPVVLEPLSLPHRFVLLGALLVLVGCDRSSPDADREVLRRGLQSDERVVEVLRKVDDFAMKGKPQEAAMLLRTEVRPASEQSAALARTLVVRSPWGQERLQDLRRLVDDRAASLDRYEAALTSELIERMVTALEEQKSLDQRGAALAESLGRPSSP